MNNSYRTKTIIVSFLLSSLVFLFGCSSQVHRAFNVQDLLISEDMLPDKWSVLEVTHDPIIHFSEDDAVEMIFYYTEDPKQITRGGITIYQYNSEKPAIRSYNRQEQAYFNNNNPRFTAIFIPDEFNYTPIIASQSRFGCHGHSLGGLMEDATICLYQARYYEFVMFSTIVIEYQGQRIVTDQQLESFIKSIDQKAMSFFE